MKDPSTDGPSSSSPNRSRSSCRPGCPLPSSTLSRPSIMDSFPSLGQRRLGHSLSQDTHPKDDSTQDSASSRRCRFLSGCSPVRSLPVRSPPSDRPVQTSSGRLRVPPSCTCLDLEFPGFPTYLHAFSDSQALPTFMPSKASGTLVVTPPILPLFRVTIASQFLSVLGRWAIMRVALPLIRSCIESRIAVPVLMPRALVASSSIKIGASLRKALAMETRCRSPPESFIPRSPTNVSYPSGRLVMNSW